MIRKQSNPHYRNCNCMFSIFFETNPTKPNQTSSTSTEQKSIWRENTPRAVCSLLAEGVERISVRKKKENYERKKD
jgi:hypothetical protein